MSRIRARRTCASPASGLPDRAIRSRPETYWSNGSPPSPAGEIPVGCGPTKALPRSPLLGSRNPPHSGASVTEGRGEAGLKGSRCVAITRRASADACIRKTLARRLSCDDSSEVRAKERLNDPPPGSRARALGMQCSHLASFRSVIRPRQDSGIRKVRRSLFRLRRCGLTIFSCSLRTVWRPSLGFCSGFFCSKSYLQRKSLTDAERQSFRHSSQAALRPTSSNRTYGPPGNSKRFRRQTRSPGALVIRPAKR